MFPQVGAYWILDQGGQGAVQTGHSTAQEVPMTLVSASRSVTKDVPVTVRRSRTWAIQNGLKAEGFSQQQMGYETNKNRDVMDNRRKFRSQTSDNMDRWKAEQGRGREKRKIRREKSRRERVRRKKMQMREKVGKSRNTVFFQWFGAPEGRKVGSLKRRVRSQLARWEMKNCTPLWREAQFRSQNVQNTSASDHFWKLRCRKSARRCGAKYILKSKVLKTGGLGPLLEVKMSKKCTPLWREAHFEVKMYKTHHARTTFGSCDVEKVHAVVARSTFRNENVTKHYMFAPFGGSDVEKVHAVVARSTFRSQNVQNTRGSDHFWRFRCRFAASPLRFTTLHYVTLHHTPLYYTTLHYTTLHNTTITTTQLDYTPLHSTTLNFTTLHYTPLHFHYTTLHYTTLPSTTLHYITLHYTTTTTTTTQLHSTTRNYTTLHYITLHYATFHYTPLHYTTLHYTTIHWMTLHHR